MRDLAEVARLMGAKRSEISSFVEEPDGTLVTTSEGAQTLIDVDGKCSAVSPRRVLDPRSGRFPKSSVTTVDEPREPIRVAASVGKPAKKTTRKR